MYKRWFFPVAFCCLLGISISCLWLVSPQTIAPAQPMRSAQQTEYYHISDVGGFVCVVHVTPQGSTNTIQRDIFVNLLPEQEVLRLKAGYDITTEQALQQTLSTLRNLL